MRKGEGMEKVDAIARARLKLERSLCSSGVVGEEW